MPSKTQETQSQAKARQSAGERSLARDQQLGPEVPLPILQQGVEVLAGAGAAGMTNPAVQRSFLQAQRHYGNGAIQRLMQRAAGSRQPVVQAKLTLGQPGDKYEQEADRVAEQVMRMPDPLVQRIGEPEEMDEEAGNLIQAKSLAASALPLVQRKCASCEQEEPHGMELVQPKRLANQSSPIVQRQTEETPGQALTVAPNVAARIERLKGGGQPLSQATRDFFEPRFGYDFSKVQVHTDSETTNAINARAYTSGKDVVFRPGQYNPNTHEGKKLLAHELTHIVQQEGKMDTEFSPSARRTDLAHTSQQFGYPNTCGHHFIQRTVGDGHDLTNRRFSGNQHLEAAFDNEIVIAVGFCGDHVKLIQEALLELGFKLPKFGADCDFGSETQKAVAEFQAKHDAFVDGQIGPETMKFFDKNTPSGLPSFSRCPPCQPTPKTKQEIECMTDEDCVDKKGKNHCCSEENTCNVCFPETQIEPICKGFVECNPIWERAFGKSGCEGKKDGRNQCIPIPGLPEFCGICGGGEAQRKCEGEAKHWLYNELNECENEFRIKSLYCLPELIKCSKEFISPSAEFFECIGDNCISGKTSREFHDCRMIKYQEYNRKNEDCKGKSYNLK